MACIERTVIVVGFAARKGNGSGVNEVCLVHRPASDSRSSSQSTKHPARPIGAGEQLGQLRGWVPTFQSPAGREGISGCSVGRYRCPSPRAVNLGWAHRQIHQKVFSLSFPFLSRLVPGDGYLEAGSGIVTHPRTQCCRGISGGAQEHGDS